MAKGFKHGAGGGAPLNFKVVGGTAQPTNPGENTIWVNTEAEITGWVFCAKEPDSPAEGVVWVTTGVSSTVEFNALKKNGIQVYPFTPKQYVGGAWVEKTAKSYQGGAWADWWQGELYTPGNMYESVTGGWLDVTSYGLDITFHEYGIVFSQISPSGRDATLYTKNVIDFTNINELCVEFNASTIIGDVNIGLTETISSYAPTDFVASKTGIKTVGENAISVDTSSVTGSFYVAIYCDAAEITVTKVQIK